MKRCASIIMLLGLVGCAAAPKTNVAGVPGDLSVSIHMAADEDKFTYMELKPTGELLYTSGMSAKFDMTPKPVTTLTAEQLRAVWQVIQQYRLLDADGKLFPQSGKTRWGVQLQAAGRSNSFHSADNTVPGVQALQDLLFKYQADVRYEIPGLGSPNLPQQVH